MLLMLLPGHGLLPASQVVTTTPRTETTTGSTSYHGHTYTVTTHRLTRTGLLTSTFQAGMVHGLTPRTTGSSVVGTKTNKKITLKTGRSNGLPVFVWA